MKGVADYAADAKAFLTAPATAKGLGFGAAAFMGATFAMAVLRVHQRNNTAEAQRRRTVGARGARALRAGAAAWTGGRRGGRGGFVGGALLPQQ